VDVRDTDHIHETAGVPRGVTSPEAIPAGDPGLQAHQGIHLGDLQEDTRVVQGAQATTKTGTKVTLGDIYCQFKRFIKGGASHGVYWRIVKSVLK